MLGDRWRQLELLVRSRLHALEHEVKHVDFHTAIDPRSMRQQLRVELAPICFRVEPGLVQLQRFHPPGWPPPPFWQMPLRGRRQLFDLNAAIDERSQVVQQVTLESKRYVLNVELDVMVPARLSYDWRGRWRSQPPSKRKRMRSWRRATDEAKLAYAPLRGRYTRVPWWARHPDAGRLELVGRAVLEQELHVFRQPSATAEIEHLLEEHSRRWCGELADGVGTGRN